MPVYDAARFYDIAFGWRDVVAECDFMLGQYVNAKGQLPTRVLEVACGPGLHTRYFAAQNIKTIGLDLNPAMLAYAKAQPGGTDRDVSWLQADMRDFTLETPVDLACCLMDSLSHLLTLDDLLIHLNTVSTFVRTNGLYILEQSHPRDAFATSQPGIEPEWEMEDESGEICVHTCWGEAEDPFDFTTQIGQLTVTMVAYRDGLEVFRTQEKIPSRLWLAGEMEAAVRASNKWCIRDRFGAMNHTIPWQSEAPAYRMVTVLEKIDK